jgi:hypothetical protein
MEEETSAQSTEPAVTGKMSAESIDAKTVSQELVQELVEMVWKNDKFLALMKNLVENILEAKQKAMDKKLEEINKRQVSMRDQLQQQDGEIHNLHVFHQLNSRRITTLETSESTLFDRDHRDRCAIQELEQQSKRNSLLITGVNGHRTHQR